MNLDSLLSRFSKEELSKIIEQNVLEYLEIKDIPFNNIYSYIKSNINEILKIDRLRLFLCRKMKETEINNLTKVGILLNDNSNKNINLFLKYFEIELKKESFNLKHFIAEIVTKKRFFELLDYQFVIKNKVLNFLEYKEKNYSYLNRMIIHMPTGTGKTKTAMHIISQFYNDRNCEGCIIWLAHTTELLNQAAHTFNDVWSVLGKMNVDCYIQEIKSVNKDKSIYFLNYAKLVSIYKNDSEILKLFIKNVNIIICDEAHKSLATETRKVIEKLMTKHMGDRNKFLLGLTATPGRKFNDYLNDGENSELALMFDKNITSIKPSTLSIMSYDDIITTESYDNVFNADTAVIKYFQERKILANVVREELIYDAIATNIVEKEYFSKRQRMSDFSSAAIRKIGDIKERNDAIINKLIILDEQNIPTVLFACSNEQGRLLSNVLSLKGIKNNAIFGDTPTEERDKAIKEFEIGEYNILINYEILATGFDSPRIKCVFITRPTNSIVLYSQMLGRGLRGIKMGGNETCLLIDVKDNLMKFNDENFAFSYFNEYWR